MNRDLLDILCCPDDKAELTLRVSDEKDGEILSGTLTCTKCRHAYPIEDGIPDLLPPDVAEEAGA